MATNIRPKENEPQHIYKDYDTCHCASVTIGLLAESLHCLPILTFQQ